MDRRPILTLGMLAAILLAVMSATGCAPLTVGSYTEHGAGFLGYRTYAWDTAVPQATGDARLDNNPFFHDRLRTNIDRGLEARGYRPGGTAADLRVHYHATVRERIDVNSADLERGFCEGSACRPFIYSAGFILIDLVDERTGTLVWRGWADGTFDGVLEDQDVMEEAVDEAVARILERLPRRP